MRGRRARLAGAEELPGLGHRHREHLADVPAAEVVFQHRRLEPLPLAHLAGGGDAGHHRQVGVDDAGAVAVGAGALGVGAEQRRLHAVGLRERLADRVEQPGVGRRVAPPRAADRRPGRPTPPRPGRTPSRGSASSFPTRPRRSRPPARRAGCRRRRPAGCGCWRRAPPAFPTASAPMASARPGRPGAARSACRWPAARRRCPRRPPRRPRCRRRGRGRRRGRRSRSPPACARRRAPCCPCRAAAAAGRSSAGCHGGAGRWWARRRRR